MLFCFCKCKIIFYCHSAVHTRSGKSVCFTKMNDNCFQFFLCLIQQWKILWIFDIRWSAGGINYQSSFISVDCSSFVSGLSHYPPEGGFVWSSSFLLPNSFSLTVSSIFVHYFPFHKWYFSIENYTKIKFEICLTRVLYYIIFKQKTQQNQYF